MVTESSQSVSRRIFFLHFMRFRSSETGRGANFLCIVSIDYVCMVGSLLVVVSFARIISGR